MSKGALVMASALAWVLLMGNLSPAPAAQASVTIEQHHELLAETLTGIATTTAVPVHRGTLPAGTTKFDPQPTATLEVVGRHTGGQSGSSWSVSLRGDDGVLFFNLNPSPVTFSNTDSSFSIKTASITWPSADTKIVSLVVERNGVAGVLSIQKAYIKIHQEGLIKKTVGRFPLGTKQTAVSNPAYSPLEDPAIYHHVAGDFDPAPTVRLRVAASNSQTDCPFVARLRDLSVTDPEADPWVPDSHLVFSGGVATSAKTPPLTLNDGAQYKLYVRIDQTCVTGGGGSAPESESDSAASPPIGDFLNADLIFEQSTSDSLGIAETVGWYPSITAAQTVDSASNGTELNFKFRQPPLRRNLSTGVHYLPNSPNNPIPQWGYVVKSTAGSAGVGLTQAGSEIAAATGGTGSLEYALKSQATFTTSSNLGSPTARMDSIARATGATAGRVSASFLRVAITLRDVTAPELKSAGIQKTITGGPPGQLTSGWSRFSPDTAGTKKATFTAALWDFSALDWTLHIFDGTDEVASTTGSGAAGSGGQNVIATWQWDGKYTLPLGDSRIGTVVPDRGGEAGGQPYTVTLTATDGAGNPSTVTVLASTSLIVDTIAPAISDFKLQTHTNESTLVVTERFSPNSDGYKDDAVFSATFSETGAWALLIGGGPNAAGNGVSFAYTWNGVGVADGAFSAELRITDLAGNRSTDSKGITRDVAGPALPTSGPGAFNSSNRYFSPVLPTANPKHRTVFSATLEDGWTPISWELKIANQWDEIVATRSGSGVAGQTSVVVSEEWLGTSDSDNLIVPDGPYTATLVAKDDGGSVRSASQTVDVDTLAPQVEQLLPEDHGNSVFNNQPLGVRFANEGSPVASGSVEIAAGGVSYSGAALPTRDGWRVTSSISWSNGSQSATLSAQDEAGNQLAKTWTFAIIDRPTINGLWSAGVNSTIAQLNGDGKKLGSSSNPGFEKWRFDPRLKVDGYSVAFAEGSAHPGWGTMTSTAPLGGARIEVTVSGVKSDYPTSPYTQSFQQRVYHHVSNSNPNQTARTVKVDGGDFLLGSLEFDLPVGVTAARIYMPSTVAAGDFASLCSDPSVADDCTPDPLRFFVSNTIADGFEQDLEIDGFEDLRVDWTEEDQSITMSIDRLVPDPQGLSPTGIWTRLTPLANYPCVPMVGRQEPICLVDNVWYDYLSSIVPTSALDEFCDETRFCAFSQASEYEQDRYGMYKKYYCVDPYTGRDRAAYVNDRDPSRNRGAASEYCQVTKAMLVAQVEEREGAASGDPMHMFMNLHIAEWGYADGVTDQLGIHWWVPGKQDAIWNWPLAGDLLPGESRAGSSYIVGVYPEESPNVPTDEAVYAYENCFAAQNRAKLTADLQVKDRGAGGVAYGVKIDDGTVAKGFPQHQIWARSGTSCIKDPGSSYPVFAGLRAEMAIVWTWARQTDPCGAACGARNDGALMGTWGHTYKAFDFRDWAWSFLTEAATSCAAGKCDPFSFVWAALEGADETRVREEETEVVNKVFHYE